MCEREDDYCRDGYVEKILIRSQIPHKTANDMAIKGCRKYSLVDTDLRAYDCPWWSLSRSVVGYCRWPYWHVVWRSIDSLIVTLAGNITHHAVVFTGFDLKLVKITIFTALRDELVVTAAFNNTAVFQE